MRTLAEGGALTPGSGVDPATSGDPICAALDTLGLIADGNSPEKYTGVQDYDDYVEGTGQYYDPDLPSGAFATWPAYPNLMDEAQTQFTAAGLDVPPLRHVRKPRRPGPGERGGERRIRDRRDGLREAADPVRR